MKTYVKTNLELSGSCNGSGKNLSMYDVKIKPIPEDKSINPKYNCPICLAMGLKHRILRRYPSCSICGIQFEWEGIVE